MRERLERAAALSADGWAMLHSDLLRCYRVRDASGHEARLVDLAVDLAVGDYPVVSYLVLPGPGRSHLALPWSAVTRLDRRRHRLEVAALADAQPVDEGAAGHDVWLKRDVADSLVLDLVNVQATRCNGLWLEERDRRLWLVAADVSAWAILHRLSRGLIPHPALRNLIDWRYVEFLRGDTHAAAAGRDYHRRVASLRPAQIARLTDAIPYLHAAELLTLIPDQVAADTLEVMTPERQVQVFEELAEVQGRRLLGLMAPDAAADLIGRLEPATAQRYLERLPNPQRARVVDLLRYPDDTVGGIMTNEVVTLSADLSVAEAREALRDRLAAPDFVYYVYVVAQDASGRLLGVVTLRDLLVAGPDRPIRQVMSRATVTADPLEPAHRVAERIAETHLNALPVVARDGRLLGAVTIDAAMAQLAPEAWRSQAPRVFS